MMKKKTCFVVEDNKEDKLSILSFIKKTPFLSLSGVSSNYADSVEFLLTNQVDILYLDIELSSDEKNGLDIIKNLTVLPKIIIISNHSEYAVSSYAIGKSVDYLLKPFSYERFLVATNRASLDVFSQAPKSNSTVFLKVGRKFQKIDLKEVLYIESFGIYVKIAINLQNIPEVINETISSITTYLDSNSFIRIHKQYIVNINKISAFDSNNVYVEGKPLPIGISYKAKVENLMRLMMNLDDI